MGLLTLYMVECMVATMHIYCIRHGESTNNCLEGDSQYHSKRSSDPELTPLGAAQAESAARYMHEYVQQQHSTTQPILYSSYMTRAVQTAAALSQRFSIPILAWRDLHERGGCVQYCESTTRYISEPGHGREFYQTNYPMLIPDEHIRDSGWNLLKAPENNRRCYKRAKKVLSELEKRHAAETRPILLISHRMFIAALIAAIVNGSHKLSHKISSHNTGITCITNTNNQFYIEFQNRYDFLPNSLRTEVKPVVRV